jgi:hypothetical protein
MSNDEDDIEYDMVMPFLNMTSNGGEYDGHAYVAGFEMGCLQGQIYGDKSPTPDAPSPGAVGDWRWMQKGNVDQLDLIAMKHGYIVEFGEPFEELVAVRLVRKSEASSA